jgi:hypothetical protein
MDASGKRDDLIAQHKRTAERESREGNPVSAMLYRNEAWEMENGNWLAHIKLEDRSCK